MRIRNIKNKGEIISSCLNYIDNPTLYKGKWSSVFGNSNPICVEVGCGRCKFIYNMAIAYPSINFVGIEKIDTVLAMGIKKYDMSLPNLRLINYDASFIGDVFLDEVDTLYLNFSDPWPKKRHCKRRLTSSNFLDKYEYIFKDLCKINFKTDNMGLFEWSVVSLSCYGYLLYFVSLDLQNSDIHDNIMTEYEEKFTSIGSKIYMLKAKKKKNV